MKKYIFLMILCFSASSFADDVNEFKSFLEMQIRTFHELTNTTGEIEITFPNETKEEILAHLSKMEVTDITLNDKDFNENISPLFQKCLLLLEKDFTKQLAVKYNKGEVDYSKTIQSVYHFMDVVREALLNVETVFKEMLTKKSDPTAVSGFSEIQQVSVTSDSRNAYREKLFVMILDAGSAGAVLASSSTTGDSSATESKTGASSTASTSQEVNSQEPVDPMVGKKPLSEWLDMERDDFNIALKNEVNILNLPSDHIAAIEILILTQQLPFYERFNILRNDFKEYEENVQTTFGSSSTTSGYDAYMDRTYKLFQTQIMQKKEELAESMRRIIDRFKEQVSQFAPQQNV